MFISCFLIFKSKAIVAMGRMFWVHFILNNFIPAIVNLSVCLYIFKHVIRHRRNIRRVTVAGIQENREKRIKVRKNKLFMYVVVTFFVLWVPFFISIIVYAVNESCSSLLALYIASLLVYINSLGNAFIYGLTNKVYRRSFIKVLTLKFQTE